MPAVPCARARLLDKFVGRVFFGGGFSQRVASLPIQACVWRSWTDGAQSQLVCVQTDGQTNCTLYEVLNHVGPFYNDLKTYLKPLNPKSEQSVDTIIRIRNAHWCFVHTDKPKQKPLGTGASLSCCCAGAAKASLRPDFLIVLAEIFKLM